MNASRRARRPRTLASLASLASVAVLAGLTACSAAGGEATATASAPSAANGSDLAAEVAQLQRPLDAYPVPAEPISGVDTLRGRTVYYVPVTQQAPQFAVTAQAMGDAVKAAGLRLQVCDGQGTPTGVNACISQATAADAGAIVTDSVAYGFAANALDAAQAAGVPVVISNQVVDDQHPASATLAYIPTPGSDMQVALAKWVALDSGGNGHLLINQSADGPSPAVYVKAGTEALAEACPGCTVTVNPVTSANFSLVPSSTSAALLKEPTIDFVESQFEQFAQPTQGGVQQANRADSVTLLTGAAQLGSLEALASGTSIDAAAGQASAFGGWVDTDAALRLMRGAELPSYSIPVRLFTRDSIADVELTEAAQQSGAWFGPATFADDFRALWGVS